MAGTRQILLRRKAVTNICKVTRTMEMISTSRYKSYYNRWAAGMDFYDVAGAGGISAGYLAGADRPSADEGKQRAKRRRFWRSGQIAACAARTTVRFIGLWMCMSKRAKKLGKELDIYAHGRKLVSTLHFHGIEPTKVYTDFDEVPSDEQAGEMADSFIEQYINGELDYFGIVYTRFYSVASQHAQTLTVMPITELIDDLTTRATVISPPEMAVENFYMSPSANEIFDELATMIVRASLRSCFIDAALSEHLARVVAMRNATENAEEMIKELTAQYNRARQGQITSELLDIIGGVGAL